MRPVLRPPVLPLSATAGVFAVLAIVLLAPSAGAATPAKPLSWHTIAPATAPPAVDRAGMAYDPYDNYTVMYGGYNAYAYPQFSYGTWAYAGGNWTQLSPSSHPSAPTGLVMAYDPALHGVLEFGGEAPFGSAFYNETWLFQSGQWTQLSPTQSPPGRSQYAMAYDAVDQEMVVFGGINGGSTELSDTWAFNGTTWTHVMAKIHPQGREYGSMVYDPITQQTLLFGGKNSTFGALSQTWAFANGSWSKLHFAGTPLRHAMITGNLANGTPLLFGGFATGGSMVFNSSFEFYSGAWHKTHFAHAPAPMALAPMTYDARDGYVMVYGGVTNAASYTVLNTIQALY